MEQEVGHDRRQFTRSATSAVERSGGIFAQRRLDRAFKFAGRVAGDSTASHADSAYIDALTQILWIEV